MVETLLTETLHLTGQEPRFVKYLRTAELAARWGTTPAALAQMRYRGTGPKHIRLPGIGIRYSLDVIEAYEAAAQ